MVQTPRQIDTTESNSFIELDVAAYTSKALFASNAFIELELSTTIAKVGLIFLVYF
jgi:hypothetical protein